MVKEMILVLFYRLIKIILRIFHQLRPKPNLKCMAINQKISHAITENLSTKHVINILQYVCVFVCVCDSEHTHERDRICDHRQSQWRGRQVSVLWSAVVSAACFTHFSVSGHESGRQ